MSSRETLSGSDLVTITTASLARRAERVALSRAGKAPAKGSSASTVSSSGLTSITTRSKCCAHECQTRSKAEGLACIHLSGEPIPLISHRRSSSRRQDEPSDRASKEPWSAYRAATRRPLTSSTMPIMRARFGAMVSASTKQTRSPVRAQDSARPSATVLRPGEPTGPYTTTTRPSRVGGVFVVGNVEGCPEGAAYKAAAICSTAVPPHPSTTASIPQPWAVAAARWSEASAMMRRARLGGKAAKASTPRRGVSTSTTMAASGSMLAAASRSAASTQRRTTLNPRLVTSAIHAASSDRPGVHQMIRITTRVPDCERGPQRDR